MSTPEKTIEFSIKAGIFLGYDAWTVHGIGPAAADEKTFVVLGVSPRPQSSDVFRFLIHLHCPEVVQAALALQQAQDGADNKKTVAAARKALKDAIEAEVWRIEWVWKHTSRGGRIQYVNATPTTGQPSARLTTAVFDLGSNSGEADVYWDNNQPRPTYFTSFPVEADDETGSRVALVAVTNSSHTLEIRNVIPVRTNGKPPAPSNVRLSDEMVVTPVAKTARPKAAPRSTKTADRRVSVAAA